MNSYHNEYAIASRDHLQAWSARSDLVRKYAWAIPNDVAIETCRTLLPIIEIGAGKGYWASLIDGDIVCYDCHANNPSVNTYVDTGENYWPVACGGTNRAAEYPNHTLFLCWPPYAIDMAADCLAAYMGVKLILIGEGDGGCTANEKFWLALDAKWTRTQTIVIPQWNGIYDVLTIWEKNV